MIMPAVDGSTVVRFKPTLKLRHRQRTVVARIPWHDVHKIFYMHEASADPLDPLKLADTSRGIVGQLYWSSAQLGARSLFRGSVTSMLYRLLPVEERQRRQCVAGRRTSADWRSRLVRRDLQGAATGQGHGRGSAAERSLVPCGAGAGTRPSSLLALTARLAASATSRANSDWATSA